ncbi:reducing type I polyketide synthase [Mytilinidion resinicola]|uniref:Reducing type I polyketide synthase n=1 Tax=Mytilinidion resinicola TaxID=574789 RepID=A0A6A6Y738_9PEZI|nr:reducing type I polyketide synthase [Mytilinidion resinicola]KAF2804409.1 reducing type I polyketide synthase [Mytilinidion resinicola]
MAFQFPSGAVTEDAFWEMLTSKHCASTDFPADRMNIDAFYSPDPKKPNSVHTKKAHFLRDDIRNFDAAHFNITPAEAGAMDPNQRGLMETTYHALESAGIPASSIAGTNTSVHAGFFSTDFMTFNLRDPLRIPKYYATGASSSILSNRISWFFNLRGPSMTIDTACSSGLVALHLACQGLWVGTSDMAIVAAANLILSPELNIALSNMNFLSRDGKCYSFDHRASGYARGEGFAVLVLKPLSKALAAGDTIRALVRSTASNQDGHTSGGITQPSNDMQTQLIRSTYTKASLDMRETRFFEAHGTGTAVGDPIEARAIGESFREYRSDDQPLYVGAVKSNVGHLEGASGLAGVIKAVLALEKGVIPPNTNLEELNPGIDDKFFRLNFPRECVQWPEGGIRRASVNSFGYGGANAHAILDDAYSYLRSKQLNGNHSTLPIQPGINGCVSDHHTNEEFGNGVGYHNYHRDEPLPASVEPDFTPKLLIFSSSDESGITRQITAHSSYLRQLNPSTLSTLLPHYSHTLHTHRTMLNFRSYGILTSQNELLSVPTLMSRPLQAQGTDPRLGIVFTGQGAQWHGMGRELLSEPKFLTSVQRSQTYLEELGCTWSLIEHLSNERYAASVGQAQYSQVLTTSVQLALVDLIVWLEINSSVVVGHSSGEIAAAYAAGHISQSSAIRVSYYRGLLASKLENEQTLKYSMAAIGLSRADTESHIKLLGAKPDSGVKAETITISCINSPSNVTVSGPDHVVDTLVEYLVGKQVFARKLKVGLGYHSPQMAQISSEYLHILDDLELKKGDSKIRPMMVSSVTGRITDASTVCSGEYWVRNMVSPVNFFGALCFCGSISKSVPINKRLDLSHTTELRIDGWLEIGPHSALQGPIRETLKFLSRENEVIYTSALVRHKSALSSVLSAAGHLHCLSFPVNMSHVTLLGLSSAQRRSLKVLPNLPRYSFNHSSLHWEEPQSNKTFRFRKHGNHDLLGAKISEPNPAESQWRFIIREDDMPWVQDHKVNGAILYPAAGMIVMAIEAAKQLMEDHTPVAFELEDVEVPAPIMITSAPEGVETRINMSASTKGAKGETDYKFRIFLCKADDSPLVVCSGTIRGDYKRGISDVDQGMEAREKAARLRSEFEDTVIGCTQTVGHDELYQVIRNETGLDYGPAFQALDSICFDGSGRAVATVLPQDIGSTSAYTVHPTRLDGIFQLTFAALGAMRQAKTMVPTFLSRLWIPVLGFGHPSHAPDKAYAKIKKVSQRTVVVDIKTVGGTNTLPKAEIDGLEVTVMASNIEVAKTLADAKYTCSHIEWKVDLDTLEMREIQEYCEAARSTKPEPVEYFNNMDVLVFQYGIRALQEVKRQGGYVAPNMERYAAWLRERIHLTSSPPAKSDAELDRLCESVVHTTRGQLHITIGQHLAEFIRGDADPQQVIFADEAMITEFYRELMEDTTGLDPFNRYLDALVHKTPGLKFLEVGAGTASSTTAILKVIGNPAIGPRFEEYMFTDITPFFIEQARVKFAEHAGMKYQALNIEQELSDQGFEASAYDVVVADNVIHATRNLHVTLGNIRKLLRPGGKLILKELVTPERLLTGFAFGLLPGWWLGCEAERQRSPLVPERRWDEILKKCGFSGTDLIFRDHMRHEPHIWTIMISTATDAPGASSALKVRPVTSPAFIIDPTSSSQKAVAISIAYELGHPNDPKLLTLSEAGLLCGKEPEPQNYIFLNEMDRPILRDIQESDFFSIQKILQSARSILWVKQGRGGSAPLCPDFAISDGLCRVSRRENNNVIVSLALEDTSLASVAHIAKVFRITQDALQTDTFDYEPEYSEMDKRLCVNRLCRAKYLDEHVLRRTARPVLHQRIGEKRLEMGIRARGLLDTIEFSEDSTFGRPLGPSEIDIEVHAIGINYKDCLTLLGKYDSDYLGSECSGIVSKVGKGVTEFKVGDRVLVGNLGVFKTYVRTTDQAVIRIPCTMTFVEAASIFTAYCTAYYCLIDIARLRKSDTILIHAAAGGTGQAMIQLAQYVGAEVFTTVGSETKKKLLMNVYGIPDDHILYSRDDSFADGIKRMTGGRGLDVVINSQQGRLLEASWECIAPFGHFIDIGLKDAFLRGHLPMHVFTRTASFSGVNLAAMCERKDGLNKRLMKEVMNLFVNKKLQVGSPLNIYPLEEAEQAIRFLQSGKSSGKIVLKVDKGASLPIVQGSESKYCFHEDATYVIAGGLGGIGRSMARWLVHRGARNLILLSRSGPHGSEQAQEMLAEMCEAGVNVQCPSCDITELSSLRSALLECSKTMPPIRGCIQAAMVLRDSTFINMSIEEWQQATQPKIQGSWNLHLALPSGMAFFILLSSFCGIFGNAGQSNYSAGNTYQDAFAGYRTSIGEKTVALDLGIVLGEGFVANSQEVLDRLLRLDLLRPNTLPEIFALIDYYCNPDLGSIEPFQSQVVTGFELPADIEGKGKEIPNAMLQRIFRCMQQAEGSHKHSLASNSKVQSFRTAFASAASSSLGSLVVLEALRVKLSRVLGLSIEHIDLDSALDSFGVDSLVGLELRNWLANETGADLAVYEILGGATLKSIAETVTSKSSIRPESWNK